jgi:hypothetical protein
MSKKHQKATAAHARANRHKAETFIDSFDDLVAVVNMTVGMKGVF